MHFLKYYNQISRSFQKKRAAANDYTDYYLYFHWRKCNIIPMVQKNAFTMITDIFTEMIITYIFIMQCNHNATEIAFMWCLRIAIRSFPVSRAIFTILRDITIWYKTVSYLTRTTHTEKGLRWINKMRLIRVFSFL